MATGKAAGQRLERARDVSALIGADATASDAFERAYTGRGDAVGALNALLRGDAADPDRLANLDRHRRSAFARPDGPADEAAVADALTALRLEAESAEADAAALDRAIAVVLARDAGQPGEECAAGASLAAREDGGPGGAAASEPSVPPTGRWRRPVLAAAVIVAAIALGAGGANLLSGVMAAPEASDAAPTPITYFRDPAVREGEGEVEGEREVGAEVEAVGDTAAADSWLSGERTPADAYPVAFDSIDPDSTRLVHSGTDGWRVWVGLSTNADYCLLSYSDTDGSGTSSCIDAEGFTRGGAMMSTGNITITWTGAEATVQLSRR